MEIEENVVDQMLEKLNEATAILTKIPVDPPDMEVSEWNRTPVGRVVRIIEEVQRLLEGEEE